MSRAMNVNATEAEVAQICAEQGAMISAIESLASGGTRVVFTRGDAATAMREIFGHKLIAGAVVRTPFHRPQ